MKPSFYATRADGILVEDALVAEIMDNDLKEGNESIIHNCFSEFDAKQIRGIPIASNTVGDIIVWSLEKDGEFSVKSTYHRLREEKSRHLTGVSYNSDSVFWKGLWNINLLNAAKNFLWHLVKGILTVRANLIKRGMSIDPICPPYASEDENKKNLFLKCNVAKLVWFAPALGFHVPVDTDVKGWIQVWLNFKDKKGVALVCATLWKIWKNRNALLFQNKSFLPL